MPIQTLKLTNFSAFETLTLTELGNINVLIGENDTGKTHVLKSLYAVARAVEEYHSKANSPEPPNIEALLLNKLKWTFLPKPFELGSLVHHGHTAKESKVAVSFTTPKTFKQEASVSFSFKAKNKEAIPQIHSNNLETLSELKTVFIPAKELLSLLDAIQETREHTELGVFDDTYYDLLKAFRLDAGRTRTTDAFQALSSLLDNHSISYAQSDTTYELRYSKGQGKQKLSLSVHQVAEGIKKLLLIKQVLINKRMTNKGTEQPILFIDEPEANLHPQAVLCFAEFLADLAERGVQIFLATHSYFLIKRLEQLAIDKKNDSYKLIDLRRKEESQIHACVHNLQEGLPDNPILEQSKRLYNIDADRFWNT